MRQIETPSTQEPGVDAERRQGGPFIRGKESQDPHSEAAFEEEAEEIAKISSSKSSETERRSELRDENSEEERKT
jgi:hypothetical protein